MGASTCRSRLVLRYCSLISHHCRNINLSCFTPQPNFILSANLKPFDPHALRQCPSLCPFNSTSPMKKLLDSTVRLLTADCTPTLSPAEVGTCSVLAAPLWGSRGPGAWCRGSNALNTTAGRSEDVLLHLAAVLCKAVISSASVVADLAGGFWVRIFSRGKAAVGVLWVQPVGISVSNTLFSPKSSVFPGWGSQAPQGGRGLPSSQGLFPPLVIWKIFWFHPPV